MFGKKQPDVEKMNDDVIQKRLSEIDSSLNDLGRMNLNNSLIQTTDNLLFNLKSEKDRIVSVKATSRMGTQESAATVGMIEQASKAAIRQKEMINSHNQGIAKTLQSLRLEKQALINEVTKRASAKFKGISGDLGANRTTDDDTGEIGINTY